MKDCPWLTILDEGFPRMKNYPWWRTTHVWLPLWWTTLNETTPDEGLPLIDYPWWKTITGEKKRDYPWWKTTLDGLSLMRDHPSVQNASRVSFFLDLLCLNFTVLFTENFHSIHIEYYNTLPSWIITASGLPTTALIPTCSTCTLLPRKIYC